MHFLSLDRDSFFKRGGFSSYRPCSCCLPRILTASASGLVIRFADDTIAGFQYQTDADHFLENLRERLGKFGLSDEVPPWNGRDHDGKEGPGGHPKAKTISDRGRGSPGQWQCEGDVQRNRSLVEGLVPPATLLGPLCDFKECPQNHPRKAKWNNEPTNSTVP